MRLLIAATAACVVGSSFLSAQRTRDAGIVGPQRIAVAMRQGDQLPPFTIEATKDGWVSMTFLSTRPDEGLGIPMQRMIADAREIRAWTAESRRMLEARGGGGMFGTTTLGRGTYQLEIQRLPSDPSTPLIAWRACGPGWGSTQPEIPELLEFLTLLDSAATLAGGGAGQRPTLSRAYYGSEVSCPPLPKDDNARPAVPPGLRTPPADIGAEFVVDTSGRVEPASIRFLPNTPREAAQSARAAISTWHFQPARIAEFRVRAVVQTTVSFRPKRVGRRGGRPRVGAEADDDGWVRVYYVFTMNGTLRQQWFDPDSIDAWMTRVSKRMGAISAGTNPPIQESLSIGPEGGSIAAFLIKPIGTVEMGVVFPGCANGADDSGPVLRPAMFTDAAREARVKASPPADARAGVHEANDVGCPAWLPWTRSRIPGFARVWRYPTAAYPASMQPTNARADVLASFVVDTLGVAEDQSVEVMPGSDPRAAAAVRTALRDLHFRPATRSGFKVRQRVIQILRFEPPPVCLTRDAGPACPHPYSRN